MLKTLYFCLLFLVSTSIVSAQDFECSSSVANSKFSTAKLKSLEDSYNSIKDLSSGFKQISYLSALDISEESEGSLWIKKPGKMKWHYKTPEEQFYLVDGKTFWQYQVEDEQAVVSNFKDVSISDLPALFLLGTGSLTNDFSILKACTNEQTILFILTPKSSDNESGELKIVKLLTNIDAKIIKGVSVSDVSGNITQILLYDENFNKTLKDAMFELEIPSSVDIKDYR